MLWEHSNFYGNFIILKSPVSADKGDSIMSAELLKNNK